MKLSLLSGSRSLAQVNTRLPIYSLYSPEVFTINTRKTGDQPTGINGVRFANWDRGNQNVCHYMWGREIPILAQLVRVVLGGYSAPALTPYSPYLITSNWDKKKLDCSQIPLGIRRVHVRNARKMQWTRRPSSNIRWTCEQCKKNYKAILHN